MKLKPTLKEFVQVDRDGQDVAGTNRYYKRQPRVGRWRPITPQPCCNAFLLTYTPSDVTDDTFTLTITCDATDLVVAIVIAESATTSIEEVVSLLKKQAKYAGKWSTDGTVIELQLSPDIALNCADPADLSFTVVAS